MAEVVVATVAKAVVGFAVGKLVAEITGNELLGAIAGGVAGGGLGFQTGQGFTWSLNDIGIGGAGGGGMTGQGSELISTMPGGSELLDGVSLFAEGAAEVDLIGGAADIVDVGSVAVNNAGGALGGLGDLAGAVVNPDVLGGAVDAIGGTAVDTAGAFKTGGTLDGILNADQVNPFSQEGLERGFNRVNETVSNLFGGGQQQPQGFNINDVQSPLAPAAPGRAPIPRTTAAGAQAPQAQQSTSFLDKIDDFLTERPGLTNLAAKGIESMLAPDEEELIEKRAEAAREAKVRFQNEGFGGGPTPPNISLPTVMNRARANSPVVGQYDSVYSRMRSPNYQAIVDAIRNRREERVA